MFHAHSKPAMSPALRAAWDDEVDCLRRLQLARKQYDAAKEKRQRVEAGEAR